MGGRCNGLGWSRKECAANDGSEQPHVCRTAPRFRGLAHHLGDLSGVDQRGSEHAEQSAAAWSVTHRTGSGGHVA